MNVGLDATTVAGFVLASVRAAAWVAIAPPFASRAVPGSVKALLAAALALPVAGRASAGLTSLDAAGLVGQAAVQAAVGAALGFLTLLVFAAVQAAGDYVDTFGGFALAYGFDPLSQSTNAVFGRFYQLLATVLLFAVNGHLLIIRGFLNSYSAVPVGGGLPLGRLDELVVHDLGVFVLSGVQIAAPIVGVLFLADAGMALLTRIAPALNAFALSFPLKILLTLSVVGLTFPLLPNAVRSISEVIARSMVALRTG